MSSVPSSRGVIELQFRIFRIYHIDLDLVEVELHLTPIRRLSDRKHDTFITLSRIAWSLS